MLVWFAETTLVATVLAAGAMLAGRRLRLGPAARHALWLVVLVKLLAPPIVSWPWSSGLVRTWLESVEAVDDRAEATDGVRENTPGVPAAEAAASPDVPGPPSIRPRYPSLASIRRGAIAIWAMASTALAVCQIGRVLRFRRRIRLAVPAPRWLVDQARCIGRRLGVRVPEILVLSGRASPMLWFLGRPRLLIPCGLVETLGVEAWRGILAHELAHLRRRDHWVRRLELAAGLLWWWNPLYWSTRRRLDAEAELACDEWAVRAFPEGRLAYAEALLHVCRSLSLAEPRVPALGVAGSGPSLERRVTMILSEPNPPLASTRALLGTGLLALLALPGWSAPAAPPPKTDEPAASAPSEVAEFVYDDRDALAADDDDKPPIEPKSDEVLRKIAAIREAEAERAQKVAEEIAALTRQAKANGDAKKAEAERALKVADALKDQATSNADVKKAEAERALKVASKLAVLKDQVPSDADAKRKAEADELRKLAGKLSDLRPADAAGDAEWKAMAERRLKLAEGLVARERHTKVLAEKMRAAKADQAGKVKPIDGPKMARPTKLQRIRQLQSLISKLNDELKALEDDYRSGERP